MEKPAVIINNISKKYRLFDNPQQRLYEVLHPLKKKYHKEFWALKDISFEIPKGSTVGIIGRNGSGKSTLLKIICSVLKPTTGNIIANGKISALLELGSGFDMELTGRENVLISGIVQGYTKNEMNLRMKQIKDFADIGAFFDQPVKLYSSGMFVRLSFSAAIHVDPDILIVDEALAVGDAKFQYKCYSKFSDFQKIGKTIILVSHDTNTIIKHCNMAILLENGSAIEINEPKIVANYYLDLIFSGNQHKFAGLPSLIEKNYMGFNIFSWGTNFYAFSKDLCITIDFSKPFSHKINQWNTNGLCFYSGTIDKLKKLIITQIRSKCESNIIDIKENRKFDFEDKLNKFLKDVPIKDNSKIRKSYNKNEYRYGDKRAEIIDYLITSRNNIDLTTINSGDTINIYVKIKYHTDIENPMTGFAIKTIDGIDVYGISTKGMNLNLQSIKANSIIVFKWMIKLDLFGGDYFIDLGCAEYINSESIPLDRRYGIAHIYVQSEDMFAGLVKIKTSFEMA